MGVNYYLKKIKTACARDFALSLKNIRVKWFFKVPLEIPSIIEICLSHMPAATLRRISRWRGDSGGGGFILKTFP